MTDQIDHYNFASELMIQVVCFYMGVALFLFICLIPPLTIMLPYAIPIVFVICIIMNIGFITRFTEGTQQEITNTVEDIKDDIGIAI